VRRSPSHRRVARPALRALLPLLIGAGLSAPLAAAPAPAASPRPASGEARDGSAAAAVEPMADSIVGLSDSGGAAASAPATAASTAASAAADTDAPAIDSIGGIGDSAPAAEPGATQAADDIAGLSAPAEGELAASAPGAQLPQPVRADASRADGDDSEFGERHGGTEAALASATWLPGGRLTFKHELAARIRDTDGLVNNRTSFRIEYEKYFWDKFYLHLDLIETAFWGRDHRARGRGGSFTESTLRDAYLQFSSGNTSVKLGNQILIWGESDAGAITDVIAPRNLSELFFISLEESRISQFMLTVDQFTRIGDFSAFYIPDAQYNEYPEPGTAYFLDGFGAAARIERRDFDRAEYGLRWKKTFGGSDVGLMAARLVDNDYVYRLRGVDPDGRLHLLRDDQRFDMIGATFNHVAGPLLLSGEIARKSPRAFLTPQLQTLEKDEVDTSLRVEYSLGNGGNHSVSLEAVNKRILDWDRRLAPTPRDNNSLVLGWSNAFLNETLTANWLTVYNQTYTSYQHSLFLTYKLNGRVSLSLDTFYLSVRDRRNELYPYRGQNNAVFRFLYQF
jgi:hypothetical protein